MATTKTIYLVSYKNNNYNQPIHSFSDKEDVEKFLDTQTKYYNNLLELQKKMFSMLDDWQEANPDPSFIKDRWIEPNELPDWQKAIDAEQDRIVKSFGLSCVDELYFPDEDFKLIVSELPFTYNKDKPGSLGYNLDLSNRFDLTDFHNSNKE